MVTRFLFILLFSWHLPAAAQMLEFGNPLKLPATVNSSAEEAMPLLSPDGGKLFFSRALYAHNQGGIYGGQDIWVSSAGVQGWKMADNSIMAVNNRNNNVVAGLSEDGKSIYFVDASPYRRMEGIFVSGRIGNSNRWSRPQHILIPGINNRDFIGFYVSPQFDVILLSMKAEDSRGMEDLYFSIKDAAGHWSAPRNLGATINTSGYEIAPFLSADKKRLYFSSNGRGGEGDADIFYSDRLYDSWETWSVPVNLGPGVNSKKFDAYFSIYGDSVAYFASNREGGYADIYTVKVSRTRTILEKGQHYFTDSEWRNRFGGNVKQELVFDKAITTLTPAQEELLFYIVNKLMLQKDIHFHLVVKEEENLMLSEKRLQSIYNYLRISGIDSSRINIEQLSAPRKGNGGVIGIRLFQ